MTVQDTASLYKLEGLEPDNLLAFLALIGLLRSLNRTDPSLHPRAAWTLNALPVRPCLYLARALTPTDLAEQITQGIDELVSDHSFDGRKDLNYNAEECHDLLINVAGRASAENSAQAALFAALMSDAAVKDDKERTVDPSPLCLLFGQGHQHFLERLAEVPALQIPPRGRGKSAKQVTAQQCIAEALFHPWHRDDLTPSFRWDPNEDVRYATMAGDPTDGTYKSGTQHGANRLAAVGLAALTLVPQFRNRRVRPSIIGGRYDADGFSFAWPIWETPSSLASIMAMLGHPNLRHAGALLYLGVSHVMITHRISVGKFMNFTRARPIT